MLAQRFLEGIFGDDAVRSCRARPGGTGQTGRRSLGSQFARFDARLDCWEWRPASWIARLRAADDCETRLGAEAFEALTRPWRLMLRLNCLTELDRCYARARAES